MNESLNEENINSVDDNNSVDNINDSENLNNENKNNIDESNNNVDENNVASILERDRSNESLQRDIKKNLLYKTYVKIASLCFWSVAIITALTSSIIYFLWEAGGSNLFLFTFEVVY